MELYKYSERIYYSSYEEERDRPAIGYIRGDRYSIAIDAGHSGDHLKEFYDLLKENNLPLPALTIITHWHWDHSFAMHKISGLSIANKTTNDHLLDFISKRSEENDQKFLALDPSIAKEYANDK
ncbi:MAG: MBL fold metallo-hydrolase, partial [Erysipelotrichaceae bacterium]|nr:MBL fold metallo-hydrolase [Erysipelotrichaceae bacterium]